MLYTLPFKGRNYISSAYGPRSFDGAFHRGFDIVGRDGTDIGAPCQGTIKSSTMVTNRSDLTWQWGNYIKLHTGSGLDIFNAHMESRAVAVGQSVSTGDKLGVMGNTGYSFGAHTHWEARTAAGEVIDPGELFGLPNMAGVTWDRKAMEAACIGYLDCTTPQYRWRAGAGTSFALYKPENTGKSAYCRKGVTYRVYAVVALPGGVVWCQITPPADCADTEVPELWVSSDCGRYTAKEAPEESKPEPEQPEQEEPETIDWDSPCNEFIISATGTDRKELRALCERLELPVQNA